jgi:hypothetical protein
MVSGKLAEDYNLEILSEVQRRTRWIRSLYEGLYHRKGNFDADYGDMTVEDKLDIMDIFVRVTPMPIKSGEMVFLCTVATLTVTMDVNIQGCCPCSGIRTWNFLMLNGLRS